MLERMIDNGRQMTNEDGDEMQASGEAEPAEAERPRTKKLKLLCRTRWVERHQAFEGHLQLFPYVCINTIYQPSDYTISLSLTKR